MVACREFQLPAVAAKQRKQNIDKRSGWQDCRRGTAVRQGPKPPATHPKLGGKWRCSFCVPHACSVPGSVVGGCAIDGLKTHGPAKMPADRRAKIHTPAGSDIDGTMPAATTTMRCRAEASGQLQDEDQGSLPGRGNQPTRRRDGARAGPRISRAHDEDGAGRTPAPEGGAPRAARGVLPTVSHDRPAARSWARKAPPAVATGVLTRCPQMLQPRVLADGVTDIRHAFLTGVPRHFDERELQRGCRGLVQLFKTGERGDVCHRTSSCRLDRV